MNIKEKLPIPETRSNSTESLPCVKSTANDENTPFKCNYCDATFSVITSLQIHMKIAHKWEIPNTWAVKPDGCRCCYDEILKLKNDVVQLLFFSISESSKAVVK